MTTLPEPGWLIAEKYRIESVVSRGGMGAIFAARHEMTGGRVAIKWMLPKLLAERTARERFIREAQLGARIEHPNVVPVFDIGEDRGSLFLVMSLLEGESLGSRLTRGALPVEEAVRVVLAALRGVAAAHALGVVHRDLKPDNIFLAKMPDGRLPEPKVLDFGISKVHEASGGVELGLTGAGALLGTPHYMAEEQVRSADDVDARADIYALGVILYECLSGRRPFDGETFGDLVLQIATETPLSIDRLVPGIDPALAAATMRAMSRKRDQRFAHAMEFAEALVPHQLGVATPSANLHGGGASADAQAVAGPAVGSIDSVMPSAGGVQTPATPFDASASGQATPFTATTAAPGTRGGFSQAGIVAIAMLAVAVLTLGGIALFLLTRSDADADATHAGQPRVLVPAALAADSEAVELPIAMDPLPSAEPPTAPAPSEELPPGVELPPVAAVPTPVITERVRNTPPERANTRTGSARVRPTKASVSGAGTVARDGDEGIDPWANDIGRAWDLGDEPDAPRRAPR